MAKCKQKPEIFRAQYPDHYTGEAKKPVHPTIEGMIQNYNKKFSELRISNVYKLSRVKMYRLPSVKSFEGENGKFCTCNMFTLKQCRNKICKMAQLLQTYMEKEYPEQLVKMPSTGVAHTKSVTCSKNVSSLEILRAYY